MKERGGRCLVCVVGEGALRKVLFSTRQEGFDKWAMACSRRGYCELREIESDARSNSVFDQEPTVSGLTKNLFIFGQTTNQKKSRKRGQDGHRKLGYEKKGGGGGGGIN